MSALQDLSGRYFLELQENSDFHGFAAPAELFQFGVLEMPSKSPGAGTLRRVYCEPGQRGVKAQCSIETQITQAGDPD